MAWIEDLGIWTYTGLRLQEVRAVGWLSKGHPYQQGEVSMEFFYKLCQLLRASWSPWGAFMGWHDCDFCRSGAPCEYEIWLPTDDKHEKLRINGKSDRELIVPGKGRLFVTPQNVAHYIDSHEYSPPKEFQAAVLSCPSVPSMEYKRAFLENGGRELLQQCPDLAEISAAPKSKRMSDNTVRVGIKERRTQDGDGRREPWWRFW